MQTRFSLHADTSCSAHALQVGLQVVLARLLFLPGLPEPCHKGLVGQAVHAEQVQGLHQGPVCLE